MLIPGGRGLAARVGRSALLLLAGAVAASAAPADLFDRHEILEIALEAEMPQLKKLRTGGGELAANLRPAGGAAVPVRLTAYGKSRLRECVYSPLLVVFDPDVASPAPFTGHPKLRLVTQCRRGAVFERCLLREYLAYRAYALVAEPALRVRLAKVRYPEGGRRNAGSERYGFFVEDLGAAAQRLGLSWASFERHSVSGLDPERAAAYALFQFMIGNTDWSFLAGPPGERCCHNTAVLEDPATGARFLVPYDLDQSGLVDAPYSVPDATLGIDSVRRRVYRGFCDHNEALPPVLERFERRRGEIEALFRDDSLPDRPGRLAAWSYLAGFYDLVADPRRVESQILDRCRRSGG